ncbi:arylsulfatase [Paracoccus sp. M683]|uniref:aspartate/glutamate racemase family protein n=1 Tax=Paracoccus sp. M683 TaxID=2594268 RepID=UPI001180C792|nr:aspartate/glutamate racemase family protein [Paracoccus sp. M683]TRW99132.1 arylsulfatase [Paracoccus sp. M683]
MTSTPRIALIHATRVAIQPIEAAFAAHWPQAQIFSILEEALSGDLAAGRASQAQLDARILRLADYARDLDPAAILFTCSAFGTGIEAAARLAPIPVLKPNEAMFQAAIALGGRTAMLYTFPPAADGLKQEFHDEAARIGADARITPIFVPGALDALKSGDGARHDLLIAEAAAGLAGFDAIMLAHFSMARAAVEVGGATALPVLTSPESAIAKLRGLLGAGAVGKGAASC